MRRAEGGRTAHPPRNVTLRAGLAAPTVALASSGGMDTLACGHTSPIAGRFCAHVLAEEDAIFHVRFTGRGLDHDLVCGACAKVEVPEDALRAVCDACMKERMNSYFSVEGVIGRLEVRSRFTMLRFKHRTYSLPALMGAEIRAVAATEGRGAS